MTVAYHGWDAVDEKTVYHPSQTGRHIGTIDGCLGQDIGMLNCTEPFSNRFPDLPCRAKTLLHSSQLRWGQCFAIDSCFTGVQRLQILGVRTGSDRVLPTTSTDQSVVKGPSQDHCYIKVDQGIFGVKSAVIPREPMMREGVGGTPLVLAGRNQGEMQTSLRDGVIADFMSCSDVVGRYNSDGQIYCFCQPADPLIESGWAVAGD